jgi:hypothetical protein
MFKRHLTLIFKVDIPRTKLSLKVSAAEKTRMPPQSLTMREGKVSEW